MNFGEALSMLKKGFKLYRTNWNGKGMYIELQEPDANSKMSYPYIYMKTVDGGLIPWTASQADLLVEDWESVT